MELDFFPTPRGPERDRAGYVGGWRITSYFGGRIDPLTGRPGNHGGMDLGTPHLTPYYAVVEGLVRTMWDYSGGGNWLTLYGPNGTRFGYGHLDDFVPGINGRVVAAGTLLGWCDSTGGSTGHHLHFAYDSEDNDTAYNDPFDILVRAANENRFVGENYVPPTPTPPEGFTMGQYEDIMGGIADLKELVSPFGFVGEWHMEQKGWEEQTRIVVLNGTRMLINDAVVDMKDKITVAGWASRPYTFCYEGSPEVYHWTEDSTVPSGARRTWIPDQESWNELVKTRFNPFVVIYPAEREALHSARYPMTNMDDLQAWRSGRQ